MSAFISIVGYILFNQFLMNQPASFGTLLAWAIGCLLGELLFKGFRSVKHE